MSRCMALAWITYKEGIRNRSVLGIVVFSLFILGLNVAVAGFFMRDIGKVTVDMNLSALSFSGLLLVLFVGLNLMTKDIEKKTIHLVLSKPVSRVEYILGKYLGILLFVFMSQLILVGLCSATVFLLRVLYPAYFGAFSWLTFFLACLFVYLKLAVMSAIVVFFSTVSTSSFVTLIFSICTYVVGQSIEEVVFYLKSGFAEDLSVQLKWFIDMVVYLVPNFSVFDFQLEAAHGLAIESERLLGSMGYGFAYVTLILLFASLIFQRREFN
ncbi:ABC transporter permease [Trichloromonas sp.]|uniref:ABC transporter permease n=1 Tax=Trichloromonas sp. TaxID=3069249 RepID=UPI003D819D92